MPVTYIRDKAGARHEVKLDMSIYAAAEAKEMSVKQYLNTKFADETDVEAYGTPFDQMCANSGLIVSQNNTFGIKSPSIKDILSGKAVLGNIEAANVADADPASRLLYPAAVIAMTEDVLAVNREADANWFDKMVGREISINTNRYEQPVISYSKVEGARRQAISQLAEPTRMLTITASDRSRAIPTESIGIEISDQAAANTTLDILTMSIARYREVERLTKAYDYLLGFLNGDDDAGTTALPQTQAKTLDSSITTAGNVTKKALVKWLWTNYYKRRINWVVTDLDAAFAIESAMSSDHTGAYAIPGMVPAFNLVNRAMEGVQVFAVDPVVAASWPSNTLMGFDSRYAITRVTNVSASYSASESFVLRRSTVFRMDLAEFAYIEYADAFDVLSLTV